MIAVLSLVVWGAFAFGAVYPWAYWPLFAGCVVVGGSALVGRNDAAPLSRPLAAALLCFTGAIALQLVPMPTAWLRWISPETDAFLSGQSIGYAASTLHPTSIDPDATTRGLAAVIALAILLLGLLRVVARNESVTLARGLSVVGLGLALAGIVQMPLYDGKVYGFWTPKTPGNPFGPFINRNHFAGWMLMTLPLVFGYFCGRASRGMRTAPSGWRNRLGWFSTAAASETILVGFAVMIMAVSLTLTTSRSGLLGLIVALGIGASFVLRQHAGTPSRMLILGFSLFVLIAAIAWSGVDRLAARFTDPTYGNRIPIWIDTLRIASRFPLTGTGFNTYGTSTLAYQRAVPEVHLAQAHGDYVQLISEGGLLLAMPALALVLVVARTIRRRFLESPRGGTEYWLRAGAVTGIIAIGLQEIGEFSLQMPGNAVLLVVLMTIALRSQTPPSLRLSDDGRMRRTR